VADSDIIFTEGTQNHRRDLRSRINQQLRDDLQMYLDRFPALDTEGVVREMLRSWDRHNHALFNRMMHEYALVTQNDSGRVSLYATPFVEWDGPICIERKALLPFDQLPFGGEDQPGWFADLLDDTFLDDSTKEWAYTLVEPRDTAHGMPVDTDALRDVDAHPGADE
jgi:hypothetical protein